MTQMDGLQSNHAKALVKKIASGFHDGQEIEIETEKGI